MANSVLEIRARANRLIMSRRSDSAWVSGILSLSDCLTDDESALGRLLKVSPDEVTPNFATTWATIMEDKPSDYQILAAQVLDHDVLALREIGNGTSVFSMDVLREERQARESMWVFERQGESFSLAPGPEENDALRRRNSTFFAYCWMQEEGVCFLQEMDTVLKNNWITEGDTVRLCRYPENGHALRAVCYEVGGHTEQTLGAMPYKPHLVQVTTDEEGVVVQMLDMLYLGAGVYAPDPPENSIPQSGLPVGPVNVYRLEDLPGLKEYDSFQASSEEPVTWVVFMAKKPVTDFQVLHFIEQDGPDDGSIEFTIDVLHQQPELKLERPLAVSVSFIGSIPDYGVSYVDADGVKHTFSVALSGEDGSVYLWEFGPPSPLGG